jgi:uncharacterized OB-fold protein
VGVTVPDVDGPTEPSDEEVLAAYPNDPVDHDTKHAYRGYLQRRLLVHRCADCGRWHVPASASCPSCWSDRMVPTEVSGRGAVLFAVRLHQGPPAEGVDYATPYPVVTVDLEEQDGVRVTGALVGARPEVVRGGLPVLLTWTVRGRSVYPAFEPARAADRAR